MPIRAELFSIERLEKHAVSLAVEQTVTHKPKRVMPLRLRLDENAEALLSAYTLNAAALEMGHEIVPAAEWLLDNYHVIEEQIWQIRSDLPPGYYNQLPKLSSGPFAGYPRVFGIAWAFVAHTDSHFTPEALRAFLRAYQTVQPLTIGELWAIAITLRIVLIENLRRLSGMITKGYLLRLKADELADRLLGVNGKITESLSEVLSPYEKGPIPIRLAAQLARRFREPDTKVAPIREWLEHRLERDNLTIDEVVLQTQQRQGASNMTVQNIVTSMRLISNTDWKELFESVSLIDVCLTAGCSFRSMDFTTRNLYRSAIEVLARGSSLTELEVAEKALAYAKIAQQQGEEERRQDPGYYLISQGRYDFEKALGFRSPWRNLFYHSERQYDVRLYAGSINLITFLLLVSAMGLAWKGGMDAWYLPIMFIIGWIPVSDTALFIVNQLAIKLCKPSRLPAIELEDYIPEHLRTIIVVPTLLLNEKDVLQQIKQMEVHHLASPDGHLSYALLSDWQDSDVEISESDEHLRAIARKAIDDLNKKYGESASGKRFLLLHRRRLFNDSESCWMGWERKRGKLHELNRLLRGAVDTTFIAEDGQAWVPDHVRYVITLDADTRLPMGTVGALIGKMAHPLNKAKLDPSLQRVVEGYAIMQPRITPALPVQEDSTIYQRVFSSPGGMDPYASTVSDVYQDVFEAGTYTGKGIYEIDTFEAALKERIPDNTLLSHDLFEGNFARAAFVSDIEFIEDFPSRYDVSCKRSHRWVRGDWQLLPWILRLTKQGIVGVTRLGQWKMKDNLRRAALAPMTFLAFVFSWFLPPVAAVYWVLCLIALKLIPPLAMVLMSAAVRMRGITRRSRWAVIAHDLKTACMLVFLNIAFLADQAWLMGDAVIRTLYRLFISRRHLLEWVTSAQAGEKPRLTIFGFYRTMLGGLLLVGIALIAATLFGRVSWFEILPFVALWIAAPAIASVISTPPKTKSQQVLTETQEQALRLVSRRTWRFFETFVTAEDNMLPPDNFQEAPEPVVAHRTSPTNIGLYLLSTVAARDFGWAGTVQTIERLEKTMETLERLERFKGHFYNWYNTSNLTVLQPPYVSSVDSGNLAGHLIALAQACRELGERAFESSVIWTALSDNVALLKISIDVLTKISDVRKSEIRVSISKLEEMLERQEKSAAPLSLEAALSAMRPLAEGIVVRAQSLQDEIKTTELADVMFWASAVANGIEQHYQDITFQQKDSESLRDRLNKIADRARQFALDMDFGFLIDPKRKLLSIGFSVQNNALDENCYDLLASEARLASLFAIAKGDVPVRHWFRLGRTAAPIGKGAALISWSGSMFEYLMPALVMCEPIGSLLDRTNHLVVANQQDYAKRIGTPWGISESAYNARDIEFTYQYFSFGVPDVGLKRGLADNHVIAPYATGLASMYDPVQAVENYGRLAAIGGCGRYGYYDAIDFTKARLPDGVSHEVVYNYMAHHQGMTLVAIANALQDRRMQARFHAEPIIHASELLLQERNPRYVSSPAPRAEGYKSAVTKVKVGSSSLRHLTQARGSSPAIHLMSNGSYSIWMTSSGSGMSKWKDIAVTRWRADASRDDNGSYIFIKDMESGAVWSAGKQPINTAPDHYEVFFSEDRAKFIRKDGSLTTTMDVLVSAECPSELRCITLSNTGQETRLVELTSYLELVLARVDSDIAHPAFSKLFIQTEYIQEYGALIATRRARSSNEPEIWAAHVAVVDGDPLRAPIQFETDRAVFLGRNMAISSPQAMGANQELSNTVGMVLDPIFSLRHQVEVEAGETARIYYWTITASSREELIDRIDTHHSPGAYERVSTLAWTQAQLQLRHLGIVPREAADFQRLAGHVVFADPRLRPASEVIKQGVAPQSHLWPQSISGDFPIVLLRIDDIEDMQVVRQLIRAHEYWGLKGMAVDLVIVNERSASYLQDLQNAIEEEVRASKPRQFISGFIKGGSIFTLRADLMGIETRNLLHAIARVVLSARKGMLSEQLARLEITLPVKPITNQKRNVSAEHIAAPQDLEFFNGYGGFARDGKEYVISFEAGHLTPMPWINVIANEGFGFQVSAEGAGYTWAVNSREYQLTPWSNDPVTNSPGESFYIRDDITGDVFSPTAAPVQDKGNYIAKHGRGYSRFEHKAFGIRMELLQFVPRKDPIKISRLTLTNTSEAQRQLSVTSYLELVLGVSQGAVSPHIVTEIELSTGALLARNPWNIAFGSRVAYVDMAGKQTSWTGDRREFLGRNGLLSCPAALQTDATLSGRTGAGYDPCAALQQKLVLEPGEVKEIIVLLGDAPSADHASDLVKKYREADLDAVLAEVESYWENILGAVQVKTPDRAMDIMLNNWLLYQAQACRITARSAFYQASGAYGFRDQLQDGMSMTFTLPEQTRSHLIRAAGRQFPEGDVQHWWLPHSGQGVRTRISDDRVWLSYGVANYIQTTGDVSILDERVPFIEGPFLAEGQHDSFFLPIPSDETASIFEHCARGLDQCIQLTGRNGLPLIGTGDWNDGMNRVGELGFGESVWLGWLFIKTVSMFAPFADSIDPERASAWRVHAAMVAAAIEQNGWDGEWYRRGYFDDGTPFGSTLSDECKIDAIAQSWAVLSEAAEPGRARKAMKSMEQHLVRYEDGISMLFTPPFDKTSHDPGYIKGYPPGIRENGGQYSHAAMWGIIAFAKLREGDTASRIFSLLNPINHALSPETVTRYKVEPYVVAADVYSVAPHIGRGGWTWYTGSASWMYRAGIENILGLQQRADFLLLDPCIPASWSGFEMSIRHGDTTYDVEVINSEGVHSGIGTAIMDGAEIKVEEGKLLVPLDGRKHKLKIHLGKPLKATSKRERKKENIIS